MRPAGLRLLLVAFVASSRGFRYAGSGEPAFNARWVLAGDGHERGHDRVSRTAAQRLAINGGDDGSPLRPKRGNMREKTPSFRRMAWRSAAPTCAAMKKSSTLASRPCAPSKISW